MKAFRTSILGCLFGGLLCLTAHGAEIALLPISASGTHTLVGSEIILDGGGQRVFLEVFLSDWDPDLNGDPTLKIWQAMIDSNGYSNASPFLIDPASEACTIDADCTAAFGAGSTCGGDWTPGFCNPGFQDIDRADYIFFQLAHINGVDVSNLDFRYGGTLFSSVLADTGVAKYGGTLVLDVPVGAVGTFTIDFIAENSYMQDGAFQFITPLILTPGVITIECQSNPECDDGNACTDDTCDPSGTCTNTIGYDPTTQCCDPATGSVVIIDDGNDCTVDACNEATGTVTHDPAGFGTECGDPSDTECDRADSCDGAGTCLDNVRPPGTACGDPSSSQCDGANECDGVGTCDPNYTPMGTACGDQSDTDCTDPDFCDGSGSCQANDAPDGTTCDDAAFCTEGETCTGGICGGGTAVDCDDGVPCTTDTCNEGTDQCDNTLDGGFCLITGTCHGEGALDPGNDCEECNTATSTSSWSFRPLGSSCDDGDACTGTGRPGIGFDECDGLGICAGIPDPECNDDCEFAVPVTEGVNTGNNDNRGLDDAEASCQIDSNNDVWFVYTSTCNGDVFMSTTGSQFTPSNDPVLSVYDACTDSGGTEIACDDDSGVDLHAALVFPAASGTNYWIRVAGFENNTGDIVLNIEPFDDCLIDGTCYPAGALNLANECEACIPEVATMAWSPRPEGSACGDPSDTICDSPDACDGASFCEANPKPDGTECADDENECTIDKCLAGDCTHPPEPAGTACGDPNDTECDNPDTCDGASACLANPEVAGAPCGDPSDEQCDNPDICDGSGSCTDNLEEDGFPCDDEDICTGADACDTGVCVGTVIAETPTVQGQGPRYLAVTPLPAGSPAPIALRLTSPDWTCLTVYIAANGSLVAAPVFQLTDDWGTVNVHDEDIVPSTTYEVVAECGDLESGVGSGSTSLWGDVVGDFVAGAWAPSNGVVDFLDITATVERFRNLPTAPPLEWVDVNPCTPQGLVDFLDISYVVDAFRGDPYPCAFPCP